MSEIVYNDIMEVEDTMQEAGVFYNGLRGEDSHCHMASYMTCINYNLLEKVWLTIVDKYDKEQWLYIARYWMNQSYLSPVFYQLAAFACRKFGVEAETLKHEEKIENIA